MIVDIQTRRLRTIGQLRAFVEGNEAVDIQPRDRGEAYGFVIKNPSSAGAGLRPQAQPLSENRCFRITSVAKGAPTPVAIVMTIAR